MPSRKDELQALGRMMGDMAGRQWLQAVLANCHVWTTSFSIEPLTMAFMEGERNLGLRLLGEMIEANPDMYIQMLKEMNSADRTTASQRGTRSADDTDDRDNFDDTGGDDPFYGAR